MKNFLLIILLNCLLLFGQNNNRFHSLSGIVDQNGNTHLIYKLSGAAVWAPIYKLNLASMEEKMIMTAYRLVLPGGELAKSIHDFEFFRNDSANFVNCGFTIEPYNHGFIARNDSIIFGGMTDITNIDISKQNNNLTFASDGAIVRRSFDGGYTYPLDSIIHFPFLSLADFDDKVFFGKDNSDRLIKSNNRGASSVLVDTTQLSGNVKFIYDINAFHVYRVSRSWGKYVLNVSNNKGNASSWIKTFESEKPIIVTHDTSFSGVLFLAEGRKIYKSSDNGNTFSFYKEISKPIAGIYKNPNTNFVHCATANELLAVSQDTIIVLKSLPVAEDILSWFPLKVGYKWFYDGYHIIFNPGFPVVYEFAGTKIMEATNDTMMGGKKYIKIVNDLIGHTYIDRLMFLRVDSTDGVVYRYWPELSGEFRFHNLFEEVGDTVQSPLMPGYPAYTMTQEYYGTVAGSITRIRDFSEHAPGYGLHKLAQGIGLIYTVFEEFGGSESTFKGALFGGTVIGDTTLVGVEDDFNFPENFSLSQNYPNPFNPSTKIKFTIPTPPPTPLLEERGGSQMQFVLLKVFDILGREVATLVNEEKSPGEYEVEFPGVETLRATSLPSGIYFYKLQAGEFVQTKKMVAVR